MKTNYKITLLKFCVLIAFCFGTIYASMAQYMLNDEDVVVNNGSIDSVCLIYFSSSNIIIPDTLDGQAITGISDYAFAGLNITSLVLPSTLTFIGVQAFYANSINSIDFSRCSSLKTIGKSAFAYNVIGNLDFTACTSLTTIGIGAFNMNNIKSIDLSNCSSLIFIKGGAFMENMLENLNLDKCTSLKYIGYGAFKINDLKSVVLNECTSLSYIGDYAFYFNRISDIQLSNCEALTYIGEYAFADNSSPSYKLPTPGIPDFRYWFDNYHTIYTGGDTVINSNVSYTAQFEPTPYRIIFSITNGTNAVEGATVTINDTNYTTDNSGQVSLTDIVPDSYSYSISATGYTTLSGSVTVTASDTNVTKNITLKALNTGIESYHITFIVTNGTNAVEGATITCKDTHYSTNNNGQVFIPNLSPEAYSYSISASGFKTVTGSAIVSNTNILEDITMTAIAVGVENVAKSDIKIYPNPTSSLLTIESEASIKSVRIVNMAGQTIYLDENFTSMNRTKQIDVSAFPQGIYMIETIASNKSFLQRVVVK